jgi:hypothetical protein
MNEQQIALALARFEAFRANLPPFINEACIVEYHVIVDAIGVAVGENQLDIFKIRDTDLERKIISRQPMSFTGRPGRTAYSKDRRCDINLFLRQVEALANYLDRRGYTGRGSRDQSAALAPSIHLHGDSPRININSVDNSANTSLRDARAASDRDGRDRFSRMTGKRVRIRPMVKRFKATGEELTPIDDIWLIETSSQDNIQLVNSASGHIAAFGTDHIRELRTDPNGGSDGMLILRSQIILRGASTNVEPLL